MWSEYRHRAATTTSSEEDVKLTLSLQDEGREKEAGCRALHPANDQHVIMRACPKRK